MKLWVVETFRDGKWRLLAYGNGDEYQCPVFSIRKEARAWKKRYTAAWHYNCTFRICRVELPGVEG